MAGVASRSSAIYSATSKALSYLIHQQEQSQEELNKEKQNLTDLQYKQKEINKQIKDKKAQLRFLIAETEDQRLLNLHYSQKDMSQYGNR